MQDRRKLRKAEAFKRLCSEPLNDPALKPALDLVARALKHAEFDPGCLYDKPVLNALGWLAWNEGQHWLYARTVIGRLNIQLTAKNVPDPHELNMSFGWEPCQELNPRTETPSRVRRRTLGETTRLNLGKLELESLDAVAAAHNCSRSEAIRIAVEAVRLSAQETQPRTDVKSRLTVEQEAFIESQAASSGYPKARIIADALITMACSGSK